MSWPFFSSSVSEFLELISVNRADGGEALREAAQKTAFPRISETAKDITVEMEVRFGLRQRVFFSRKPHGTVWVRIQLSSPIIR